MQRFDIILDEAARVHEAERNPDAQRKACETFFKVIDDNRERLVELWDDLATQKAAPVITYLKAKNEARL